ENRNLEVIREVFNRELGYSKLSGHASLVKSLVRDYQMADNEAQESSELLVNPSRVFENIDGIKFLSHQGGCGGTRDDARTLCQLLAGYIANPNVAGVTVMSLGCQHAQVAWLKEALLAISPEFDKPMLIYEQQLEGNSEEKFIAKVIKETFDALKIVNLQERKPAPLSKL